MQKKILVVDDDADLVLYLTSVLSGEGYQVSGAYSGTQALEQARAFSPDLIILDLMLPERDGFTVCETLRKEKPTARTPILMLTAVPGEMSRFAGLGSGADDYVLKPITGDDLLPRVRQLLSRPTA